MKRVQELYKAQSNLSAAIENLSRMIQNDPDHEDSFRISRSSGFGEIAVSIPAANQRLIGLLECMKADCHAELSRIDDPYARASRDAMRAYATSISHCNKELADDLIEWVNVEQDKLAHSNHSIEEICESNEVLVNSSHGHFYFNSRTGEVNGRTMDLAESFGVLPVRVDVDELRSQKALSTHPGAKKDGLFTSYDVLDVGFWDEEGHYEPPEDEWRKERDENYKICKTKLV